jgi:hypothetical protein
VPKNVLMTKIHCVESLQNDTCGLGDLFSSSTRPNLLNTVKVNLGVPVTFPYKKRETEMLEAMVHWPKWAGGSQYTRKCVVSLLQKWFIVPAGNLSLVPVRESDTLCVIQKMAYFLCQLLSTDTKDPSLMSAVIMQPILKNLFMVSAILA